MALTILPLTDFSGWEKWQPAWDNLLKNSTAFEARVFLSFEWLTTWWKHLGRGRLLVLTVADGNQLLAAAPLFISPSPLLPFAHTIRFIGNGNADYGDFLVRQGYEEIAAMIWHWLFEHRSLWDVIALHELPESSIALIGLRNLLLPQWIKTSVVDGEPCHRIPLKEWDEGKGVWDGTNWRKRASKALQQQLRRRERQIAKTFDTRFQLVTDADEVPKAMAQLFALHRLRWAGLGQTGVFVLPKVRSFHTDFAQQALRRGWLRLHLLTLNGITAAAYYAFLCDGYAGFYTCGFHPDFSRYSVGKVLLAKVIDDAEREGASIFDFMRGGESYKAEFGTITAHNRHLFVWQADKPLSRAVARLHQFTTCLALRLKHSAQR